MESKTYGYTIEWKYLSKGMFTEYVSPEDFERIEMYGAWEHNKHIYNTEQIAQEAINHMKTLKQYKNHKFRIIPLNINNQANGK